MLDHVCIFSKVGIVLWSKNFVKVKGKDPVVDLIDILLEEKAGGNAYSDKNYTLKWVKVNKYGTEYYIVVVQSSLIKLPYVDSLLDTVRKNFFEKFDSELKDEQCVAMNFDKEFNIILRAVEKKSTNEKKARNPSSQQNMNAERSKVLEDIHDEGEDDAIENIDVKELKDISDDPAAIRARLQKKNNNKSLRRSSKKIPDSSDGAEPNAQQQPKKMDRVWAGVQSGKLSKKQMNALDRSKPLSESEIIAKEELELEQTKSIFLPEKNEKPMWELENEEAEEFERVLTDLSNADSDIDVSSSWMNSYLGNMIQSFTGSKILTEEDLIPVLQSMNEKLQEKNVAQEIADEMCASVCTSLVGQKLASFTRISTVVIDALRDAIQRILTPSSSVDVLRQVLDARSEGTVFSIVFVGINGVGKSTSLAKVAYYLKQYGINVLIAACDTFRSGAVEQLRTHSRCLDAPLFEMGYSKDPSNVARCALAHAQSNAFDCVLIDTAGRMQNNEPLMKSLAKLVSDNRPNLVLFVGEALVGNDGIDQLSMFDHALVNYSPPDNVHRIDGIVLTKFDTIDDKVGAALSMTYKSGQPVTFVGTGQKYIHLKKLNVNTVLKHLFET